MNIRSHFRVIENSTFFVARLAALSDHTTGTVYKAGQVGAYKAARGEFPQIGSGDLCYFQVIFTWKWLYLYPIIRRLEDCG